ncbi:MAG: hypothetical protein J0I77_01055 [Rudaea sp.]|uniref:hypothetical protein n=1 Tax=unclassified Rudaea TaxID=2627037 RepID=UPI0010F68B5E|nr:MULTISPECIES: hypothetical protein [unclassified Rudaea]MBN8884280.1 hypothetical protein [Rudaea sp.]MBR0345307.1 hypothetical protein [Rudaea sp.]
MVMQAKLAGQEDALRRRAFENAVRAIDYRRQLPERVFVGKWEGFFFCESDRIFHSEFIDVAGAFLHYEQAHVVGFINLDAVSEVGLVERAAIFADEQTTGRQYMESLQGSGPADGWLYQMGRYIVVSDVGDWCIYCEKGNEVAVVGVRSFDYVMKFESALGRLMARPIEDLVEGGRSPLYPFDQLVPEWRKGLIENYGRSTEEAESVER